MNYFDNALDVLVLDVVRDEGTVLVFRGQPLGDDYDSDDPERVIDFAVDHRMAQPLIDSLVAETVTVAAVEPWQIVGYLS
jgi:hypothetical protein